MDVINSLFLENHGDAASTAMADDAAPMKRRRSRQKPLAGAYLALLLFVVVYFARPEDLIPGLSNVPLAKITAALAVVAFVLSLRHVRWPLPREVIYLILLVGQFFISVAMSPVWPGGAFQATLEFCKVIIVVLVMTSAVITLDRFLRLVFVQAASVAMIAGISVWKGRLLGQRLEGTLSGNYSNPNDLALAIVISLPLCMVLLLRSRDIFSKAAWTLAMLVMIYAICLTGSRGGFLSLVVAITVCLWEFGVRRRYRYLLLVAAFFAVLLLQFSPRTLTNRLKATFNSSADKSAYESTQHREQLFWRSVEVTAKHPLFGVGPGNFEIIAGYWQVSHNTFTELSSEGGLPALVLFVLILSRAFNNLGRVKRLSLDQREPGLFAGGFYASLAGYVVGAVFTSTAYQFFPYLLVAYSTALRFIAKKASKRQHGSTNRTAAQLYACEAEPEMPSL